MFEPGHPRSDCLCIQHWELQTFPEWGWRATGSSPTEVQLLDGRTVSCCPYWKCLLPPPLTPPPKPWALLFVTYSGGWHPRSSMCTHRKNKTTTSLPLFIVWTLNPFVKKRGPCRWPQKVSDRAQLGTQSWLLQGLCSSSVKTSRRMSILLPFFSLSQPVGTMAQLLVSSLLQVGGDWETNRGWTQRSQDLQKWGTLIEI